MSDFLASLGDMFLTLVDKGGPVTTVLRFIFPVLALAILVRCAISLLRFR